MDNDEILGLIRDQYTAVVQYARKWLKNHADAEDVAQEVFASIAARPDESLKKDNIRAWLLGITRNKCRMHNRAAGRRRNLHQQHGVSVAIDLEEAPYGDHVRILELQEVKQAVQVILILLPENQYKAAKLYYIDGCTYKEIQRILGLSKASVESRLHRARGRIKRLIHGSTGEHRDLIRRFQILAKGEIGMDDIRLEIGKELVPMVTEDSGQALKEKVGGMRKALTEESGVRVPRIHIIDNLHLPSNTYAVYIAEDRKAVGELAEDTTLADLVQFLKKTIQEHQVLFS